MKLLVAAFILSISLCGFSLRAQLNDPDLCRPDVIRFEGKVYVFGYKERDGALLFSIQRFSPELKYELQNEVPLGAKTCKDFYSIGFDTLHNYLNFTVQEASNDKTCRVIRFDRKLKMIADIPDAEVARVNTFTAYEKEFCYYKNELYVVRPLSKDSANKFILQKYTVKDSNMVFEYMAGWQLNFARQQYHRCKIFDVDEQFVYMFTNVINGSKKGQWIQFVGKGSGEIVYSIKLNADESSVYLYAAHYIDPETRQLYVAGYRFQGKSVAEDYTRIDYPSGKVKPVPVFVCSVDSVGELAGIMENAILPPTDIEREKEFRQYLFKIQEFRVQNSNYYFLCDVAGSTNGTLYKTYGYAFCPVENDLESGTFKPKPAVFNCTYRDSKIKEAKFIFNTYGVDVKNNAEEVLYKPAAGAAFKQFKWNFDAAPKAQGIALFANNKESALFKYRLEEGKWKNTEAKRDAVLPFQRIIAFDTEQFLYFKNTSYDPEMKIIKGIEGAIVK